MAETPTPEPTSEPTPVITTRQVVIPAPVGYWGTPYYPVGVYFVRQEGAPGLKTETLTDGVVTRSVTTKIPVLTIQSRGISTWKVQTIAHATTRTAKKTLYEGVEKVKVAGVAGQRKVLVDLANKVWKTVPVTSPVTKQVLVGTYVAPAWLHPVGTNGSPTSPVGYRIHPITKTASSTAAWTSATSAACRCARRAQGPSRRPPAAAPRATRSPSTTAATAPSPT